MVTVRRSYMGLKGLIMSFLKLRFRVCACVCLFEISEVCFLVEGRYSFFPL